MSGTGATSGAVLGVREAYRLWAPTYDEENAVTALEQAAVRRLTPPLAGVRLLDVGCGTGRRMPRGGRGAPAFSLGIDLVPGMLRQAAARRARPPALLAADVRALPCRSAGFDVVWCRLVLGHVADLDAAYRELARVARRDAYVIVTDFHCAAARAGHLRTFRDAAGALHAVEHYLHDTAAHTAAATRAGLTAATIAEPTPGPAVRHFYAAEDRLEAYRAQRSLPLVLALLYRA